MHRRNRTILIFSLVLVAGIALVIFLNRAKPIAVVITTISRGEVQDTVANTRVGTLKACRRARLSPSIGGQIASLPVHEGDSVKTGQVLLEMWNEDLSAEVELAKREALAANSRAEEACVVAAVAQHEAQRLTKLHKKGLASEESTDKAEGEAKAKRAGCKAARATTQVSEARLDVTQASLARTRLIAPFDGTVAEVNGELGEFVTPSPIGVPTPPAVDLIDNTCLYVSAPIDEVDAPEIRTNMPTHISLDAYSGKYFKGKVRRVAPYVQDFEKQARTVDIEVDFIRPEDSHAMLPGYSADVEVILNTRQNVLRLPTEALLEGNRILLYQGDAEPIEEKTIHTGLSNWQFTEVLEGLEEGEQIVVSIDRDGVEAGAIVINEEQTKRVSRTE